MGTNTKCKSCLDDRFTIVGIRDKTWLNPFRTAVQGLYHFPEGDLYIQKNSVTKGLTSLLRTKEGSALDHKTAPRVNVWIRESGDPGSLSVRRRMRRRIFWYQGWHICNLLSWDGIQFTEGYFRKKSTKMHQKERRSILTKSVSKIASIELPDSAFESADAGEQNSQPHRVSMSLAYVFSKA